MVSYLGRSGHCSGALMHALGSALLHCCTVPFPVRVITWPWSALPSRLPFLRLTCFSWPESGGSPEGGFVTPKGTPSVLLPPQIAQSCSTPAPRNNFSVCTSILMHFVALNRAHWAHKNAKKNYVLFTTLTLAVALVCNQLLRQPSSGDLMRKHDGPCFPSVQHLY